ncbi:hypothetical protein RJ640_009847 [Escallonia rubra]|uniref:Uncharacterized protein n=1 Tax=Escallonia rubra TaxID=112253 RepID=A0AA88U5X4_9ASTE|nr:hypothetical protein RJ640_009847 [Escallonia rubra]
MKIPRVHGLDLYPRWLVTYCAEIETRRGTIVKRWKISRLIVDGSRRQSSRVGWWLEAVAAVGMWGWELNESDVWTSVGGGGVSPDYRKPVVSSRKKPLAAAKRAEAVVGGTASSLPEEYKDNRRRDIDDDVDGEDLEEGGDRVPPHEFLARQFVRTRIASFSAEKVANSA